MPWMWETSVRKRGVFDEPTATVVRIWEVWKIVKVKDIIEELSKFDENLEVMFLIQDKKYHNELSCRKVYINTDADGNEVYCIGNNGE